MNTNKFCLLLGFLSLLVIFQAIFIMDNLGDNLRVVEQLPVELRREIETQAENDMQNFQTEENKNVNKDVFIWFEKKDDNIDSNFFDIEIWMDTRTSVNIVDLKINYSGLEIIDEDVVKAGTQIGYGEASRYLENNVSEDNKRIYLAAEFENGFSGELLLGTIRVNKIDNFFGSELFVNLVPNSKEESYAIGYLDRSENILSESSKLNF